MSPEQELLEKWRSLDKEKQEEVLDFVKFIHAKMVKLQPLISSTTDPGYSPQATSSILLRPILNI
jgi:hypothetical protein